MCLSAKCVYMCRDIWAKSLPKNETRPLMTRHHSLGQPHALRVERV